MAIFIHYLYNLGNYEIMVVSTLILMFFMFIHLRKNKK